MEDHELDDFVSEYFELEALDRDYVGATGRTHQCLPVPALIRAARSGLSAEERSHVSSCRHCTRFIAMSYREECPSPALLLRYLFRQTGIEKAIEIHVGLDNCPDCRSKLDSGALALVKQLVEAGKIVWAALSVSHVPKFPFALHAAGETPAEPFQHTAKGEDGLTGWLRQTEYGELMLRIRSENPADAGRSVFALIALKDDSPLAAVCTLEQFTVRKEGEAVPIAMVEHSFGPAGDQLPAISKGFELRIGYVKSW